MSTNSGFVYCLTVPRMPGVVKIGYTTKTMEQRLKDLDNTSVVEPLQLYYAGKVRNPLSVEKKIHEIYREWRIRPNREFFEVDADQVKRVIQLAEVASLGLEEEKIAEEEPQVINDPECSLIEESEEYFEKSQTPSSKKLSGVDLLDKFKSTKKVSKRESKN